MFATDGNPVGWDDMQIFASDDKRTVSDVAYSNVLGRILYGNLESICFGDLQYWESLFTYLEWYRFIVRIKCTFFAQVAVSESGIIGYGKNCGCDWRRDSLYGWNRGYVWFDFLFL